MPLTPGAIQEFTIDCPGCAGTGKSALSASNDDRCINCRRTPGTITVKLTIPKQGQKVKLKYGHEQMLVDLFGRDDKGKPKITPDSTGVVFDVQEPKEHQLELLTGVGVRVAFSGLTVTGKIPKGKTVDLWTFDLYELRIV